MKKARVRGGPPTRAQRVTFRTLRDLAITRLDSYAEHEEAEDLVEAIRSRHVDTEIDTARLTAEEVMEDPQFQQALRKYINGLIGCIQQVEDGA